MYDVTVLRETEGDCHSVRQGLQHEGAAALRIIGAKLRLCLGLDAEKAAGYSTAWQALFLVPFDAVSVTIMASTAPPKADAISFCASYSSPSVPRYALRSSGFTRAATTDSMISNRPLWARIKAVGKE